jgi:DNA-binding transcriptional regulator GbsR (MarR family)
MAGQGNPMHEGQIRTVISLLAATEMTIPEIAQRMGCSRSAIAAVNRKFQVRQYQGRRSTWVVSVHDARDSEDNSSLA